MSEITKNENNFIGYEYKDITVTRSMESVYTDGYSNFGWALDRSTPSLQQGIQGVTLKFKRDRKIRNKVELTRLQRQFDSCVAEIEALESSKATGAMIAAFSIGLVGTAFMAGSVFAYLAGMILLCIILAIPAFIGWILPYFCYNNIRRNKIAKVEPLIDSQYDKLYDVCEKANALLAK
jgi:hypothetical protein